MKSSSRPRLLRDLTVDESNFLKWEGKLHIVRYYIFMGIILGFYFGIYYLSNQIWLEKPSVCLTVFSCPQKLFHIYLMY